MSVKRPEAVGSAAMDTLGNRGIGVYRSAQMDDIAEAIAVVTSHLKRQMSPHYLPGGEPKPPGVYFLHPQELWERAHLKDVSCDSAISRVKQVEELSDTEVSVELRRIRKIQAPYQSCNIVVATVDEADEEELVADHQTICSTLDGLANTDVTTEWPNFQSDFYLVTLKHDAEVTPEDLQLIEDSLPLETITLDPVRTYMGAKYDYRRPRH